MKLPKKAPKESSIPSQNEYCRFNVLQEQILSKFQIFGDALSAVRKDVNSMRPDLQMVRENVAVLKSAVRTNGQDIRSLKEAVQENTEQIGSLKVAVQENTE